ncbi:exonuclease [uncultured phage cr149_1]|uniref:Exonuclease n=1 Tax=uncultured phage cr149_1 TaxID=2986412 RepID=A0AAE7RTY7_9CAUD|nr:exonuclease [uncultured phage cr149_1]QWM89329.1 exonuclease [uncultured phage cr149_1]
MDISIPYYEDLTRISNSNIGWFLKKGPKYLKEMLDGKEGLKASFLDKGTMIHEYILQPEEFWKDYIILDFAVPKVKQQKDLLEFYANAKMVDPLASEDDILLMSYNSAYSNNKSIDKRIQEAKELVELYQNYIEYFKNKDSKKVISFADLNMLKTIKKNMEDHKKANELLFNYPETFEVHNEFHINWEYPNASSLGDLPCKSLLDRVMIDHTNKKIILVDIKTTADVYNFKHSVEEFDYCRQLAYYWLAIHWYFKNELKLNIEEYEYETYIIAVQSHDGYEVRVFKFNPKTVEERLVAIDYAIKRIAWHKDNNLWDHMKEYYDEDGAEMIC